jgi:hypothetical protein
MVSGCVFSRVDGNAVLIQRYSTQIVCLSLSPPPPHTNAHARSDIHTPAHTVVFTECIPTVSPPPPVSSYNRNTTIEYNAFEWLGESAIVSVGDTEGGDDRLPFGYGLYGTNGTQPRGSRIRFNTCRELGIWEKQSSFYTTFKSGRNLVEGNLVWNGQWWMCAVPRRSRRCAAPRFELVLSLQVHARTST